MSMSIIRLGDQQCVGERGEGGGWRLLVCLDPASSRSGQSVEDRAGTRVAWTGVQSGGGVECLSHLSHITGDQATGQLGSEESKVWWSGGRSWWW